jgi:hypothetical protein
MSEQQSPHPIVVLPSHHGWEREANSHWDEETGRKEEMCFGPSMAFRPGG